MSEPIQRDGVWWHQKADGTWLRWNAPKNIWEHAPAAPPPPAPPAEGPARPLEVNKPARTEPAFGFSIADPDPGAAPAAESGAPEVAEVAEVAVAPGPSSERTPVPFGAANGDVLPPESDKPTVGDWVTANRTVAAIVVAVLLVGALAFAAFSFLGGDDPAGAAGTSSTATPGASAGKKVAVRKLNSLCNNAKREVKRFTYPTTPAEFVVYMEDVKDVYRSFMRKLVRIDPGPAYKAAFAKIVNDSKTTAAYVDKALAAAQSGDLAGVQSTLQKLESVSAEMNGRARAFGAHACASA